MNSNLPYIFIGPLHLPSYDMILIPDNIFLALCLGYLPLFIRDVLGLFLLDLFDLSLDPLKLLLRVPVIINNLLPHYVLRVLLRTD